MHLAGSLVSIAVMVLSLGLVGCGGSSRAGDKSGPKAVGSARASVDATSKAAATGPVEYATSTSQACMLHQEAGGHYLCLSGADGQCFHYGAVCEPADSCTLELSSNTYKVCKKFTEGACQEFGAACKPKGSCLYDPGQRRYRSCASPKLGGCSEFGTTCDPS